MRAIHVARFGGPDVLAPVEVDRPSPISTEVLVEVHAAGVNPVDPKTRRGNGVAAWTGPPPFIPGWDVAGVVVATGYGVTRFRPGDRVFGMPRFPRAAGAYAEYVTAPSLQLARIPDGLDFTEAAAVPLAGLTAWQALTDAAGLQAGQTVLVHGASGGVGHLAVQLARARDARVIATTRAESDGLDAAREVDVVVDLVGGTETSRALRPLRPGGVLLAIADGADEATRAEADRAGVRVLEPLVEPDGRGLDEVGRLLAQGAIRPTVTHVLPLSDAADAHRRLEQGGVHGKIVLLVRDQNDQNSGRSAA